MNFNISTPGTKQYNKMMMMKHLEQKKRKFPTQTSSPFHQDVKKYQGQDTNILRNSTSEDNKCQITWKIGHSQTSKPSFQRNMLQNNSSIHYQDHRLGMKNSNKYRTIDCEKMRKIIKDQLEESVVEQSLQKKKLSEQWRETRQTMARQNGVLDYLENEESKRNQFIKKCLINQEFFQSKFIDENSLKNSRIFDHINQNYDPDVFNHESDKYQRAQKINNLNAWQINNEQKMYQMMRRQNEKQNYGKYFDDKIRKYQIENNQHNPLTNPLEYHIDNPYLRKKMLKY